MIRSRHNSIYCCCHVSFKKNFLFKQLITSNNKFLSSPHTAPMMDYVNNYKSQLRKWLCDNSCNNQYQLHNWVYPLLAAQSTRGYKQRLFYAYGNNHLLLYIKIFSATKHCESKCKTISLKAHVAGRYISERQVVTTKFLSVPLIFFPDTGQEIYIQCWKTHKKKRGGRWADTFTSLYLFWITML